MRAARIGTVAGILLTLLACNGDSSVKVVNSGPAASITAPTDGSSEHEGVAIEFVGLVSDDGGVDNLVVQWISDVDGILIEEANVDSDGSTTFTTANLTPDYNHAITLLAYDGEGESDEDAITITIVDLPEPPEIEIVHPVNGEVGYETDPFQFVAIVSDAQDDPQDLFVTVSSDNDGWICDAEIDAAAVASCEEYLSAGQHLITFIVSDTDGYSSEGTGYMTVTADGDIDNDKDGWTENQGDCDDSDSSVYPGAEEVYNAADDDCDGTIDEGTVGYDDDGDGYSENAGDCDDDNANTYPGASQIEDGEDNDCDSTIDEGTNAYDDDGDGYTENAGDCDDADSAISPDATEECDSVDNDCDGTADEPGASDCTTYYADSDGDGYGDSGSSQCQCSADSSYSTTNSSDCYDSNSSANPAQTNYFTTHRGDGSYDYDCDSSETKRYTTTYSCSWNVVSCSTTQGWTSSSPSCGGSGTWVTSCSWDWFGCSTSTTSVTQECK